MPISGLRAVHLTGVSLPPRPVLPRTLQAWRVPAFHRRLGPFGLGALPPSKVLVAHRVVTDCELQHPVEKHPSTA